MNRDVCPHGAPVEQRCERCTRRGGAIKPGHWQEDYDFARAAFGWWPAEQNPATAGLFVVKDIAGNVEVATWLCDWNGKNGGWTKELRDVNRDEIVAWMRIPD